MRKKHNRTRGICAALFVVALSSLALAGSASAKLTGEFAKFAQCPYTNLEVSKCLYSPTEGGEVVLGNKKVPIVTPVYLQGGFGKPNPTTKFSTFYGATNGITLSKGAQPVPGGLLGIVPPEKSPPLVKALSAFFFENALTGVNSTLELANGTTGIKISENHLVEEEGVALEMQVKLHLENPFLGKSCYVGSSGSPVTFKLTTGETNPPPPNTKIVGAGGTLKLFEEGSVLQLSNVVLVDNAWSAPAASGCGGILAFLVNPIINSQIGLPAAAGKNTAILKNTINVGAAAAVRRNNEEHP